jgi:hypothetical protein
MKRSFTLLFGLLIGLSSLSAQEPELNPMDTLTSHVAGIRQELDVLKRVKVGGYIQAQFQIADSAGAPSFEGGNFASGVDKRFSIRRGRIKAQYDHPANERGISTSQVVLQLDMTERGVRLMDGYVRFTDPIIGWFSLTTGLQNRPFGYEVILSSSLRESPERGRMSQILFPNERDMGMMLTVQAPKTSRWNWLKMEAGFFNGMSSPNVNVDASDFDKKKDFIGHLVFARSNEAETFKYSGGISYYNGGYRLDTLEYGMSTDSVGVRGFRQLNTMSDVPISLTRRGFTHREYYGADLQLSFDWKGGITVLRGEYIAGDQPGISSDTRSPIANTPINKPTYNRPFNGAYFYLCQSIGHSPLSAVIKYDWYDPNTDVKGDELGKSVANGLKATNATDVRYDTWGFGLAWRMDENTRVTAYYDQVKNETSQNLSTFTVDQHDNVFTLRVQTRF